MQQTYQQTDLACSNQMLNVDENNNTATFTQLLIPDNQRFEVSAYAIYNPDMISTVLGFNG